MHLITAAALTFAANAVAHRKRNTSKYRLRGIPSFRGIIEHRHSIPGRHRFVIPVLKDNPKAAELLKEKLPVLPGVETVICSSHTGSVLITGDRALDPALLVAASARVLGLEQAIEKKPKSRMSEGLKQYRRGLDHAVHESTRGILGLNDAVGLLLIGISIAQIRKTRALGLPPAFTLLWWFYTMNSDAS